MVATFRDPASIAELTSLRQQLAEAKEKAVDLKAALDLANADLKATDQKYRDLLRKQREANPEPDDDLRGLISIDDRTEEHERPYAEREEFDQRMQAAVEDRPERRNYILRVRFFKFGSIPVRAKGSIGVDREWSADLLPGSVRKDVGLGVMTASYAVEVI